MRSYESRLSRPSENGKLVNIRPTKSVGKKYTSCIASQQSLITSIGGLALKYKDVLFLQEPRVFITVTKVIRNCPLMHPLNR